MQEAIAMLAVAVERQQLNGPQLSEYDAFDALIYAINSAACESTEEERE